MYFVKTISFVIFLILLIDGFADAKILASKPKDCIKDISQKAQDLKQEVDEVFQKVRGKCEPEASRQDYEKLVSQFLNSNYTIAESTTMKSNTTTENLFEKMKNKIYSVFHRNKTEVASDSRIKRCLMSTPQMDGAEITIEQQTFNMSAADIDNFEQFLSHLMKCLKKERKQDPSAGEGKIHLSFQSTR